MLTKKSAKFFKKDGKVLKAHLTTHKSANTHLISSFAFEKAEKPKKQIFIHELLSSVKEKGKAFKFDPRNLSNKFAIKWIAGSSLAFAVASLALVMTPNNIKVEIDKYSIYASKPLIMDTVSYDVYTRDSRSQRINEIFKTFNCPLEGMGEKFVQEADKNDIPWWIAASIAFQESSCGKVTPKSNGEETYNAWGWAVYEDNVHEFDNWARGIETVSRYLGRRFYSQGITDTCDIMKVYTPPSDGSWCASVNHFGDLIQNFKTP